eukprot:m.137833 g.137833  ORF g.137833 m.137833 type:complete len:1067 (-) comp16613_c0_seq1:133-3333(-)
MGSRERGQHYRDRDGERDFFEGVDLDEGEVYPSIHPSKPVGIHSCGFPAVILSLLELDLLGRVQAAGDKLKNLVDEDDRQREQQHGLPLVAIERLQLEQVRHERDVEDDKVQDEGEEVGGDEVEVAPGRHAEEGLVLADAVEGVEELDDDEDGEGHGHGAVVVEDVAAEVGVGAVGAGVALAKGLRRAALEVGELAEGHLRAVGVEHEPPGRSGHGGKADVAANDNVAEEQPAADELVVGAARRALHDVEVRRVEAEGCGRQAVCDQVDPQQLHGDEGVGQAQRRSEEDADNLADVGGDQVADKLLGVVVDGAALLDSSDNGGEVVVGEDHGGGALGDRGAGAHGHADVGLLQGGGVVDTVAGHGDNLGLVLQVADDATLVGGLDTGKEVGALDGLALLLLAHGVKLLAGVGLVADILRLGEDANAAADGNGGVLVVAGDDNDADAGRSTSLDRGLDLLARRVQHADHADKGHVALKLDQLLGVGGGLHLGQNLLERQRVVDGGQAQAAQRLRTRAVADEAAGDDLAQAVCQLDAAAVCQTHILAALQHLLRRALAEHAGGGAASGLAGARADTAFLVSSRRDVDAHGLAVAVKLQREALALLLGEARSHLVQRGDGAVGVAHLLDGQLKDVELLGQDQESRLRSLAHLVVAALGKLEAGVVAHGADLGQLDDGRVRLFPLAGLDLLLVERDLADGLESGAGHLKVQQRLVLGVGRVDNEEARHRHLVGGQRAGLVGADDGGAAQGLHRRELADKGVLLGHAAGAQSQAGGDDGGKTLGDGGDGEGDGDFEVVNGALEPVAAMHGVAEMADVDEPDEDADVGDVLAEGVAKFLDALLERGLAVLLLADRLADLANLRVGAGRDDNADSVADRDVGAGEADVELVLVNGAALDGIDNLVHAGVLAGENGLVHTQVARLDLEHAHVGGDLVADGNLDDVAGHKLARLDLAEVTLVLLAQDLGRLRLVLLERLDGVLCVALLPDADGGVADEDDQDDKRLNESRDLLALVLLEEGQHKGDDSSAEQDAHKRVLKLLDDEGQHGLAFLGRQLVGAPDLARLLHGGLAETC